MARLNAAHLKTVATLILIPGVFALLLKAGYHLVSLFVQLMWHTSTTALQAMARESL